MARNGIYTILLLIHLVNKTHGQILNRDSVFNQFKKDVLIELDLYSGKLKMDDETMLAYYTLMSMEPLDSLVRYTDDSIPAIRARIFSGLVYSYMDSSALAKIIENHDNDTATYKAVINYPSCVICNMREVFEARFKLKSGPIDYKERLEKWKKKRQGEISVIIPGAYHNMIAKDTLLKVDRLLCSIEGWKVASFILSTTKQSYVMDNKFTDEIREVIRNLKVGDIIYFDQVKVILPDNTFRLTTYGPLKLR